MSAIHPTAIIEKGASIGANVTVGPYSTIGSEVTLEEGVTLHAHVNISGKTHIGKNTAVFPFASLGTAPQDLKFKGENSQLIIGSGNVIREHVTMNAGTQGGGMITRVGSNCLFMVGSHVAHDCQVGNHVILANNATLAGHVTLEDHVIVGGLAAIHQFVRVGKHAMIGGMSGVEHDVIPYGSVMGDRASLAGLNLIGLKRRNFDRDTIHALRGAFKMLFAKDEGTLFERVGKVQERYAQVKPVADIIEFMEEKGPRSLCVPKERSGHSVTAD